MSNMEVPLDLSDHEVVLDVEYTWTPGRKAIRPSLSSFGAPGESPEVDVTSITVDGDPVPKWFHLAVIDYVVDYIMENHEEDDDDD